MTVNLQPYKIVDGDTDYPDKHDAMLDAVEAEINGFTGDVDSRLDDQDAILAALSGAITSGVTFKGSHSAAGGTYPSTPSTGDYWIISATGTISNVYYTVGDAIVYSGSTWIKIPANPDMSRINPLARAVRVAMTAASSGSNGIKVLDNANIDFGIDNFSIHAKISLADWTPGTLQYIYYHYQNNDNRIAVYVDTSGALVFLAIIAGVRVCAASTATNITTSTAALALSDGEIADITISVTRETTAQAGNIKYFVRGVQLGASIALLSATPASFSIAGPLYFLGTDIVRNAGCFLEELIYNRDLTAAEALDLSISGPALADMGASQVPVYTSDFSAGVDGWAVDSGRSIVGNQDGIDGEDNWATITRTDPTSALLRAFHDFTIGDRLELQVKVYLPVGAGFAGVGLFANAPAAAGAASTAYELTSPGSSVTIKASGISTGTNGRWYIATVDSSGNAVNVAQNQNFSFKTVTAKKLGLMGRWSAEDCQGDTGQIFDRSGNKNHALLPAAGATRIPAVREFEVRWTNTWAGTHEAQYIGGTNQAILNANACITSIVGKVSGASSQNIIVGDGSDGDRFVASVALVDGVQVFTIANATTDGTNRKLVADPDANFTGSIIWTIRGYILEA